MATKLHKPPSAPPNSPNPKLATKMSSSLFEKLPDEVILKVLSFVSFKSLGNCNQVSRRMKTISEDTSLWEKIEAWRQVIPSGFIEKIVKLKVKSIIFNYCEVFPVNFDFLKENNLDLKYMEITNCSGDNKFLAQLVKCSKSLEYLNIEESRSSLAFKCIENIAYPYNLKVICLNKVKFDFISVKEIIDWCTELTDLCINNPTDKSDLGLTEQSIAYICANLTSSVLRVDLSWNRKVQDQHIQSLVNQCKNLEHLDLVHTRVTYKSVPRIVTALSHSLVSLALPNVVGIEIGLPLNVCMEKLKVIFDLIRLENLHIGCGRGYLYLLDEEGEIYRDKSHIGILANIFPNLTISTDEESPVLNTDPYCFFMKQAFKQVYCFPKNMKLGQGQGPQDVDQGSPGQGNGEPDNGQLSMTLQDQLSKYVETL